MNSSRFLFVFMFAIPTLALAEVEDGGEIVVWPRNPGTFLFVNTQKRLPSSEFERPVSVLRRQFAIDIKLVEGTEFDIKSVPAELESRGAKGAIWIVDSPFLPVCLAATESGWGVLNVAHIVRDNPSPKLQASRVGKLAARLFGMLHGAASPANMPVCVLKNAVGMEGVDGLRSGFISPGAAMRISNYLELAGYKTCNIGSYYEACEEGWAPAPTNAVQKAIWDKVHQLPTKPIRILPKNQRDKKR